MGFRSGVGRVLSALASVRHWPRAIYRAARNWLRDRKSAVLATVWLAGMAAFVGLNVYRVLGVRLEEGAARLAELQARERARIAAQVDSFLEKRSVDAGVDAGTPGDGGTVVGVPGVASVPGEGAPGGRGEVVELMDIDEIERMRGGSDEESRAAIKGLQEEYEGEEGGVAAGDGGVEMETVVIPGKTRGEDVTIRMKKGGLAGWIARNKKYRKRKLGDKETLEILAEVTGGAGTKVRVNANSPLSGLEAIAAIRGSAAAEEAETKQKPAPGSADASTATTARPTAAVGLPVDAAVPTEMPHLDLEVLGLATVIAIVTPAESGPATDDQAPTVTAMDAVRGPLEQLATRHKVALVVDKERLVFQLPPGPLFGARAQLTADGATLVRELVALLEPHADTTFRLAGSVANRKQVRSIAQALSAAGVLSNSVTIAIAPAASAAATGIELAIHPR